MLYFIRERVQNPTLLEKLEKLHGEKDLLNHCSVRCVENGQYEVSLSGIECKQQREESDLYQALQLGTVANTLLDAGHCNFGRVHGISHGQLLLADKHRPCAKETNPRGLISDCFQFALALAIANQHHEGFCIDPEHITRRQFPERINLKYQSKAGNIYYLETESALSYHRYYQGSAVDCLRRFCDLFGFQEARAYWKQNQSASLQDFVNYLFILDLKCKFFIVEKQSKCSVLLRCATEAITVNPCCSRDFTTHYLKSIEDKEHALSDDFDYMSGFKTFHDETMQIVDELEKIVTQFEPVQLTLRNYGDAMEEFCDFSVQYIAFRRNYHRLELALEICNWLLRLRVNAFFEKRTRVLRTKLNKYVEHFLAHLKASSLCIVASLGYLSESKRNELGLPSDWHTSGKKEQILTANAVEGRKVRLNQ